MSFMPPNQAGFENVEASTREAEVKAERYAKTHLVGNPSAEGSFVGC